MFGCQINSDFVFAVTLLFMKIATVFKNFLNSNTLLLDYVNHDSQYRYRNI